MRGWYGRPIGCIGALKPLLLGISTRLVPQFLLFCRGIELHFRALIRDSLTLIASLLGTLMIGRVEKGTFLAR